MPQKNKPYNPEWNSYVELWRGIQPPWRPNANQHLFYTNYLQRCLKSNTHPKILVFGSTPEIRDLCARLKLPITIFDFNEEMYNGMQKLMLGKPYQEKFVQGKWEETSKFFQENEFDLIFSDETQNNMGFDSWTKNFQDIQRILKKDGYYFFATMVQHSKPKITFEKVVEKFKKEPSYFQNFQNRVDIYYRLLNQYSYNWIKRTYAFHDLRRRFKDFAQMNNISLQILEKILPLPYFVKEEVMTEYYEIDPPLGEVYELIIPHFWIKEFYIDRSHPVYRFRRDMVLRPKK